MRDSRISASISEELRADQLVHGVMASHVLAQNDQTAFRIEQSSAVQAASAIEEGLCLAQARGQGKQRLGADGEPIRRALRAHGLQRQQ
jgi:hypothetical protein